MAGNDDTQRWARIDRALDRIEAASTRRSAAHQRLRARVGAAIEAIDDLLARDDAD